MRIAVVSDFENVGGAAAAASRLARGLHDREHEVLHIVGNPGPGTLPWSKAVIRGNRAIRALDRLFLLPRMSLNEQIVSSRLDSVLARFRPDFVSVHNVHSMSHRGWGLKVVDVATRHAPIGWTLHDMWSFTGGCAYSGSCDRYSSACDEACTCPDVFPKPSSNEIRSSWLEKRALLSAGRSIVGISPSRWLIRLARKTHWAQNPLEIIPYGIPTERFRPALRTEARTELGIPDGPVLLMSAVSLDEARKGGAIFRSALWHLETRPLTVLLVGIAEGATPTIDGIDLRECGFITTEEAMSTLYNAADLFVHPAIHDNLPNVILEAMSCGTPTVGFDIGGIPEMVREDETGWLASATEPASLAATIDASLEKIARGEDLREACRQTAVAEYSLDVQARRYESLVHSYPS